MRRCGRWQRSDLTPCVLGRIHALRVDTRGAFLLLQQRIMKPIEISAAPDLSHKAVASVLEEVLTSSDSTWGKGSHVGTCQLVEKLGEGGFGIVWRAQQNQPLVREVALKLIKPGIDSEEVLARFQREQQLLARLDHPCIARVFDAGLTLDERPYIIMELVHGLSITRYCKDHELTLEQKITLFRKVCSAIQHAHEKGVIHRDLKPSNILVTDIDGQPHPKIIDFGIAKALNHEGHPKLTWMTRHRRLIGTPAYMSPEQTTPDAGTDVRTDIYALGVLLYELIAGCPPFTQEKSLPELLRQIQEHEPKAPSLQHGKKTQKRSGLRPITDLDWITLRCLEKERDRRYPHAEALHEDLMRWEEGRAVSAHPPTHAYLMSRWFRRNRSLAIAIITVGLALVTGTALALWQAQEAQQQQRDAEAVEAALINAMHQASATKIGHAPQSYDLARDVLNQFKAGTFPGSVMIKRDILMSGSTAAMEASDHDTALWALEEALKLTEKLKEMTAADVAYNRVLVLGALMNAERNHEANERGQYWLSVSRKSLGPTHARTLQLQSMTAEAMRTEKITGHLELQQDAVAKAKAHLRSQSAITIEIESRLVRSFDTAGRHSEALALAEQLIPSLQKYYGTDHAKVWFMRAKMGDSMLCLGRTQEARNHLEGVLARQTNLFGAKHPHTLWTQQLLKRSHESAKP